MVRLVMRMIDRRAPDELSQRLLVTDAWPTALANKGIDALTFSGGVAEYLYKREKRSFGDLGADLAHALAHMLAHRRDLPPVWDPGQGIRATVIGAAQFSVQISGNTITISEPDELPLQNLPVIACDFELADSDRRRRPSQPRYATALARSDIEEGAEPGRARLSLARRPVARPAARARRRHLRGAAEHPRSRHCRWCF